MKIVILAIGKPKSAPIRTLVEEYAKRIKHYAPLAIEACRDDVQALAKLEPGDQCIVLDERGDQMGSRGLAEWIAKHQMQGTKRLVFFIGGPDGVGASMRQRANLVLGLSQLTFPHEFVQVILAEQLYRAFSILKGEPYHR